MKLLLALVLLVAAASAAARTVKLCLAERELLPVSSPRFEAPGQYLARKAIEKQGDQASFTALPWTRCVAGIRGGLYDGAIGVVPTESFMPFTRFPMAGLRNDVSKSIGNIVFVAMRPMGGQANWDGEHFENVTKPVLYNPAARVIFDKLADLGVPRDAGTPQEAQMLAMMLAGRAEIAIGREDTVVPLAESPAYAGRIEVLPRPFVSTPTYLAFGKSFHDANAAFDEAVWNEIVELRQADDWEDVARRLLQSAHKD